MRIPTPVVGSREVMDTKRKKPTWKAAQDVKTWRIARERRGLKRVQVWVYADQVDRLHRWVELSVRLRKVKQLPLP